MMPLLMNQGIINTQPMNVNPYNQNNRPNDESIVVGQPVQPNPYYQPYSPVGVPQQPGNWYGYCILIAELFLWVWKVFSAVHWQIDYVPVVNIINCS